MPGSGPSRQALVVLGMHRSGTSAVAGALVALGATPPATLMPVTPDNPLGYHESVVIMDFDERVLASAGSSWDDPRPIPPDWYASEAAFAFGAEVPALMRAEFGDAPLPLLKDPRISRFLPLWTEALAAMEVRANVLLCVRDPFEVARSIRIRDGIDERHSLLSWLRHSLDAERDSRALPRQVLAYDRFVGDPAGALRDAGMRLGIEWPVAVEDARLGDAVREDLRHHRLARPEGGVGGIAARWAAEAYASLLRLAERTVEPDRQALAALDGIRRDFDLASEAFGPLLGLERARTEQARSAAHASDALARQVHRQAREIAMLIGCLARAEPEAGPAPATDARDPAPTVAEAPADNPPAAGDSAGQA
jgi:hypothetical protein